MKTITNVRQLSNISRDVTKFYTSVLLQTSRDSTQPRKVTPLKVNWNKLLSSQKVLSLLLQWTSDLGELLRIQA